MGTVQNIWLMKGLDINTIIFQYMDLDYLLCLLGSNKYYIKQKNTFEDKNESKLPLSSLFRIQAVGYQQPAKDRVDNSESLNYNLYQNLNNTLTSCWTLRSQESILMWKAFTSKMGVRIKSTINNFAASFESGDYDVICGQINYKGYSSSMSIEELMFSKQRAYGSEKEIRFYFFPKSDKMSENIKVGLSIPVKVDLLIDEIMLSPYINKEAGKFLRKIFEEKYNITTRTSTISVRL